MLHFPGDNFRKNYVAFFFDPIYLLLHTLSVSYGHFLIKNTKLVRKVLESLKNITTSSESSTIIF